VGIFARLDRFFCAVTIRTSTTTADRGLIIGRVFKREDYRLCCPPDKEQLNCEWYGYDDSGNCAAKCLDDSFELRGTSVGCSIVNSNY
jgi:hypothetical protein